MTGRNPPIIFQFAVDHQGAPAPGAALYHYVTNTAIPKAIFADFELTTALPQPLIADAEGRYQQYFLESGQYTFVEYDAPLPAGNQLRAPAHHIEGFGGGDIYTLPVATADTLGGVKEGDGTNIAPDGTISTTYDNIPGPDLTLLDPETLVVQQITGVGSALDAVDTDFQWTHNPGPFPPSLSGGRGIAAGRAYVNGLQVAAWCAQSNHGELRWTYDFWATTQQDTTLVVAYPTIANWNSLAFVYMAGAGKYAWVAGNAEEPTFYCAYHEPASYNTNGTIKTTAWFTKTYAAGSPNQPADIASAGSVTCYIGNDVEIGRTTDWNTFAVAATLPGVPGGIATDSYGKWFVVMRDTGALWYSTADAAPGSWAAYTGFKLDGVTVSALPTANGEHWSSIMGAYGLWVAVNASTGPNQVAYCWSRDGVNWFSYTGSIANFYSVGFDGARFYATNPAAGVDPAIFQLLVSSVPVKRRLSMEDGAAIAGPVFLADLPSSSALGTDQNGKVIDIELSNATDPTKGAGRVGYSDSTAYTGSTLGAAVRDLRAGADRAVRVSEALELGETSSTAYRGDRGKTAYDHSQLVNSNPHQTTYPQLLSIPAALDAIDGLTPAADRLAYYTGASTAALAPLTAFARTLIATADAAAARSTLGAQASLGYTPVNRAGDTMTGNLTVNGWIEADQGYKDAAGVTRISSGGNGILVNLTATGTTTLATSLSGILKATAGVVSAASAADITGNLLTGYTVGSNAALAATDTILGAFRKTQGQLDGKMSKIAPRITTDVNSFVGENLITDIQNTAVNNPGSATSYLLSFRNNNISADYAAQLAITQVASPKLAIRILNNTVWTAWDYALLGSQNPDLVAIEALSATSGYLRKTAANTWTLDDALNLSAKSVKALTSSLFYNLGAGQPLRPSNGYVFWRGSKFYSASGLTLYGTATSGNSGEPNQPISCDTNPAASISTAIALQVENAFTPIFGGDQYAPILLGQGSKFGDGGAIILFGDETAPGATSNLAPNVPGVIGADVMSGGAILSRGSSGQPVTVAYWNSTDYYAVANLWVRGGFNAVGSFARTNSNFSANKTLTITDQSLQRYTGTGGHTLTLCSATNTGRQITVKHSGTGSLTVSGGGSDTIDGGSSISLTAGQYASFSDVATAKWERIG